MRFEDNVCYITSNGLQSDVGVKPSTGMYECMRSSSSLLAIRKVLYLHFHSKQSAWTPKKTVRLLCQVSLKS